MSFFHSIKFKFALWYLMILGVILVSLSFGVYFYLSNSLYRNLDNSLTLRAEQIQTVPDVFASIREGEFQEELSEMVLLCFYSDSQLMVISRRDVGITVNTDSVQEAIAGQSSFVTTRTAEGQELRLYVTPFLSAEGPGPMPGGPGGGMTGLKTNLPDAALVIGRPTKEIDDALDGLVNTLLIAVPLTMIVAGVGGIFLAGRALKPVDHIAQTALEIEGKDLSRRIPVSTKDELGRLASVLNEMIDRLERAFKRQQQFTGDASHELRTPLAVIQAEATLALQKERATGEYRESLATISEEARHMASIIEKLLTLARADSGTEHLTFEEIDLGQFLTEIAADADVLCQHKGLTFQLGGIPNPKVKGDRSRLRELFLNLLDNAVKYTPAGGTVSLSIREVERMAVVDIQDTGIGIPPEHTSHVFERFYRVDKARSRAEGGTGLGLAICRHIAEAHGGRIEVASEAGKGSTFSVWLPLA